MLPRFAAACLLLQSSDASITKPPFSWDTVGGMLFIQVGDPHGTVEKPLETATRDVLAKFPMVCFEKFQGKNTPGAYEDKTAAACKALKDVNPKLSCIMYLNTECGYTGYRMIDELYKRPEFWLKKPDGKACYQTGCHNGGCHSPGCPKEGLLVPDYSIPDAAKFYFEACSNMTRDGPVDGCNMDRSNELDPGTTLFPCKEGVPKGGNSAWHHGKLMGEIDIADKAYLWINNIGTSAIVKGAFGNCIEGFGPNEKSIQTLQELAREGLGAKAHCCRTSETHVAANSDCSIWDNVQDGLAAFLIGAGENAFFGCGNGFEMGSWIKWYPQYDYPLGSPMSDGVKGVDGTWTRRFESGTTVQFDPKSNKGIIKWATPSPSPPAPPTPPSPPTPSPSDCGTCTVCFNPTSHECQDQGAHRPKTKSACEAKHHIWCGARTLEQYV